MSPSEGQMRGLAKQGCITGSEVIQDRDRDVMGKVRTLWAVNNENPKSVWTPRVQRNSVFKAIFNIYLLKGGGKQHSFLFSVRKN